MNAAPSLCRCAGAVPQIAGGRPWRWMDPGEKHRDDACGGALLMYPSQRCHRTSAFCVAPNTTRWPYHTHRVTPAFIAGAHVSAGTEACGWGKAVPQIAGGRPWRWMDPGDKHRDDACGGVIFVGPSQRCCITPAFGIPPNMTPRPCHPTASPRHLLPGPIPQRAQRSAALGKAVLQSERHVVAMDGSR